MNVLVTGGAGFIGSNLVDALLDDGHDVAVLDDFSSGREENLTGAIEGGTRVLRADIRDAAATLAAAEAVRPDAILHLAAQVDVRKSVADPAFDLRTNVEGTVNVLQAAREVGARIINISTGGAIYGDVAVIPTPETVAPEPEAPYGHSKLCAEGYVRLFAGLFGVRAVTARLGNVYGPRQDPHGEAGVIAIFCGLLHEGHRPTVFGTGLQTRDYVYVDDVVAGLIALLDNADATGIYNVGTGVPSTVVEIIEALAHTTNGSFDPIFAPERPGEIDHSCLDVSRAAADLGWTAQVSLSDGLARTADWTLKKITV